MEYGLEIEGPEHNLIFRLVVVHKRIMCNEERVRRGFTADRSCKRCPGILESVQHVFQCCGVSNTIWNYLIPAAVLMDLSNLNFDEWIRTNVWGKVRCDLTDEWGNFFSVMVWWLWRCKNDFVFNDAEEALEYKILWLKAQHFEFVKVLKRDVRAREIEV